MSACVCWEEFFEEERSTESNGVIAVCSLIQFDTTSLGSLLPEGHYESRASDMQASTYSMALCIQPCADGNG